MDRRAFLIASASAAFALDRNAWAAPAALEASATRSSPRSVKLDWSGPAGSTAVFVSTVPSAQPRGARPLIAAAAAGGVEVEAPASPRPYFLVKSRGGQAWTAERLLPLQGGRNFRDLGGYRGAGGKQVRWGKIYRSGVMASLTPADMDYLGKLGVGVICDLRNVTERRTEPTPFLKVPGVHVSSFDYEMNSSLDVLARARTPEQAIGAFATAYVDFLDMLKPQYTDMFARLARGEGPLALNCSAGKDRTGVGSALILSVLGVPRETVVADYALTEVYTPPSLYMQAMNQGGPVSGLTQEQAEGLRRMPPELLKVIMGSNPEVMRQALAMIDRQYGGPVELVKSKFGLSDAGVARMRGLYLI